jgi:putative membrane protein insertion efficiency factor
MHFLSKISKLSLLFVLFVYQKLISPLTPRACRFHPTCSQYSKEAILKFGAIKGVYLTFRRIIRCHPFNHDDYYDPVPSRKEEKSTAPSDPYKEK